MLHAIARPLVLVRPRRKLNIRLTEHKQATRNGEIINHIADRHFQTNHIIDCVTGYSKITINNSLWKAGLLT